ncbi:hypothetical protein HPB47_006083 [Ixodes persulcatus]|uniref:Uncharacterized protein n=1 Tax=Ixodes persulcatus TaxID=34615 RepID=A0AC60PBC5_IXOPE|nr:hypothetical protein HPB47_006083 [Ixodes persulcatus]
MDTTSPLNVSGGVSTCIASTTARTHAPDLTWWIGPGVPQWRAEPDTWGSDHMPIKIGLHSACLKKIRRRVTVTHWDKLREVSATMTPTDPTELLRALQQLLRDSIITTTVDEDQPQPDLTLLQLWAKRRQADVAASRNPTTPVSWESKKRNIAPLGSIPTPARFDLDEHRTGVRSCITTAWCTLKTPG